MKHRKLLIAALLTAVPSTTLSQEWFDEPFPAHEVMAPLYYVGTRSLSSYLVATADGHILINSGPRGAIDDLRRSIASLGFELADIKIILGSHAHWDHQEADASLRELTGAVVMVMEEDVALWSQLDGPVGGNVDRVLHDGDEISLGGVTLEAHRTPGHTPGCTSWGLELDEAGTTYDVLIVCSFGVNLYRRLVLNREYPGIADDFRATFAHARSIPVDVFLGAHGDFYNLEAKYEALRVRNQGEPNPFVDPVGYQAYVDRQERGFNAILRLHRAAAGSLLFLAAALVWFVLRRRRRSHDGESLPDREEPAV